MKATCWTVFLTAALLAAAPTRVSLAQAETENNEDTDVAEVAENQARWPRIVSREAGTVTIHTPQVDSWEEFLSIRARAAIEVTVAGESNSTFGVLEFVAKTEANLERRLVSIKNIEITETGFSSETNDRAGVLDQVVREVIQPTDSFMPLDVLLTYTADDILLAETDGLSFEPPQIFHSFSPAYLLQTNGAPIPSPIEETDLQFVVNTNWDLFRYRDREWFLRLDKHWLNNKDDALDGQWEYVSRLPGDFKDLPESENWQAVRDAVPAEKTKQDEPTIFVSERPAELIVIDGAASVRTVGGPGLEYVTTTESDLFRFNIDYYFLVSGRWFKAPQLAGPWEFTAELPDAFLQIPEDHEKGHVLAAIPGTFEAKVAAVDAQLPVKATVRRDAGDKVTVTYDGEPQFEVIDGTEVQRVINSPADVFLVDNVYYLCSSGAWYQAMSAAGPWVIADTIPAAIYSIPPSSSSYHVTHVHVYESDADTVTTGYSSGYLGVTVAFGVAMYGTGWYYPPYYRYPYYYPYPYSFGSSAWYNPNTGRYGRTASVYGPYGGYGRGASYNPSTGSYTRGAAVWDNDEVAFSGAGYNPRTGTGVATNRYVNEDGGWGESIIRNDDKWVATESQWSGDSRSTQFNTSEGGSGQIDRTVDGDTVQREGQFEKDGQTLNTESIRGEQGGAMRLEGGGGESATLARKDGGDLYAGKDGEVYRRTEDGWQHHDGEGWDPVEVPDDRAAELDERRNTQEQSRDLSRETQGARNDAARERNATAQRPQVSAGGGFATTSQSQRFGSAYESKQVRSQDLDRSHNARSAGTDRYNAYQQRSMGAQRQKPRRRR
jgi:hypothetical protein